MLARVLSSAVLGVEAYLVEVEADIAPGLPHFTTVGLPDGAVRESKERVASAIKNSGYQFPVRRVTINLAPADMRKEGSAFDLPIAVGILAATGQIERHDLSDCLILGELSLDGSLRPIKGVLPMAIAARQQGLQAMVLPQENAKEAAITETVQVYGVATLQEAVAWLDRRTNLEAHRVDLDSLFSEAANYPLDFSDVRGQEHTKRALEVAAAGGHNILTLGTKRQVL